MSTRPDDIPQDVWDVAEGAFDLMLCNCREASGSTQQLRIDSIEPLARTILAAKSEERHGIIADLEDEKGVFLSTEYSVDQPIGSFRERFAIDHCIAAIRKRGEA